MDDNLSKLWGIVWGNIAPSLRNIIETDVDFQDKY